MAENFVKQKGHAFAVRADIVRQVRADPVFSKRLDNTKSVKEKEEVFKDFCKQRGIEVREVK
jgi:hypothetical protein